MERQLEHCGMHSAKELFSCSCVERQEVSLIHMGLM